MNVLKRDFDKLHVEVHSNRNELGTAAATQVVEKIKACIATKGEARVIFASAPSQLELLQELRQAEGIDWTKVVAFNQDEYIGASLTDAHSFGKFIKEELYDMVHPGTIHFIDGRAADVDAESERYATLLEEREIDIICLGVGENGHVAFNEPHEADFNDPKVLKTITLDEKCRVQQFHDFGFPTMADVPEKGVTITIPVIMKAANLYCMVPSERKAEAVRELLLGEISEKCPASVLRLHDACVLFLDADSAKLLNLCH